MTCRASYRESQSTHESRKCKNNCSYWLDSSVRGRWMMSLPFAVIGWIIAVMASLSLRILSLIMVFFFLSSCIGHNLLIMKLWSRLPSPTPFEFNLSGFEDPLRTCHGLKAWGPNEHMEFNCWTHEYCTKLWPND